MRSPLSKRVLALLTLLVFAAGISYEPLCAAGFVDCPPCHGETSSEGEEEGDCETCGKSAQLAHSAQPSKPVDVPVAFLYLAFSLAEQLLFTVPEHVAEMVEPPPAEHRPAMILRDIRRSIPIRGPSVTV